MMDFLLSLLRAFAVGGAFCAIAQVLIDRTAITPARILVGYVVLGVALTGVGIYQPLVDFAGTGATTPLLGFGYSLAKGVERAIAEQGAIGILTGGLSGAAAGITAALAAGFLASLLFRPKAKR